MKIKVPKPKTRRTWKMNPRTRVKEDERAYRRSKAKTQARKMIAEEAAK
jgi:hypothetical protein